jgi:hypothetical protein
VTLLIVGVTLRLFVGEIAVRGADQCFDKFLRVHRPVGIPQVNPCICSGSHDGGSFMIKPAMSEASLSP